MPALTPEQAESLVERGSQLLEDAARLTSGVDPNYIRDAQPESLFEALPLAAARQGCRRYADKGGSYPPLRAARAERACRPYLDSLDYGTPPALIQPFDGGQCAGRAYRVIATFQNPETGAPTGVDDRIRTGPITVIASGNQAGDPGANCEGTGLTYYSGRALVANGTPYISWGGLCGNFNPLVSISVTPQDGGSDECGNPPPDYTPPVGPTVPGPVREPFTVAPNIDVDISVEVNIDGSIDVDFGTGPITIDPFGEPPNSNPPSDGGGDGVPGPGTGAPPVDTGDGGAVGDTAPEGFELVGLKIEVLASPVGVNTYDRVAVQVFRGVGYVRMGYPGRLGLDLTGSAVISPQFFFAPVRGLTVWEVRANNGFINRVTPFYRELPQ